MPVEPAMVAAAPLQPSLQTLSSGSHAHALILDLGRRIRRLEPEVLADNDPEALHQLRVSLRRLRTVLVQFAPALVLPRRLRRSRVAAIAQSTGRTRDLDVLQQRFVASLQPLLPGEEQHELRPFLRHLARARRRSFRELRHGLRSGRSRRLLASLADWNASPRYTTLGRQPLLPWLHEWHLAAAGRLFLHPGWFSADPRDPELHDLRKRIKEVRYGIDHLQPVLPAGTAAWIDTLKQAQGILGDLHDLEVMHELLRQSLDDRAIHQIVPTLSGLLAHDRDNLWQRWQLLAARLLQETWRRALLDLDPEAAVPALPI
ncbi:MAG: CHAD domain-containing protein [Cyanobacteriota bacterium]|jgi:CHAD domain-containing protein